MKRILGIHDGHNASVALWEDGQICYAIQEERLVGEKNKGGFPKHAVEHVLSTCNLPTEAIDLVGLASHFQDRSFQLAMPLLLQKAHAPTLGKKLKRRFVRLEIYRAYRMAANKKARRNLISSMGFRPEQLRFVGHHHAHAAMAYYGMREDEGEYLILTLDGSGDWLCSTVWRAAGGRMKLLVSTRDDHSLGCLYATVTRLLGFLPLQDEYKVMGLAAYCSDSTARKKAAIFEKYLGLDPQNPMRFKKKTRIPMTLVGPRLQKEILGERFDHVCGGLQYFTERLLHDWVSACIHQTGIRRLICGGGVFMNVKGNKRLMEMPEIESLTISPSCGDETLSLGCCYDLASQTNQMNGGLRGFYLGNDIEDKECEAELKRYSGLEIERPVNLADRVAQLLSDGYVVARVAGRMEFGARALGNRSLLADAARPDIVRIINRMIKNRDFWMPFAPAALRSNVDTICINARRMPSPYMMMAFDTRDVRRNDLIAALHPSDFTARLQIVEPGSNPEYEAILEAFEKRTGRVAVLNTSFNLHGYPIVCTAKDALDVFVRSGLQWLVLGPLLIGRHASRNLAI